MKEIYKILEGYNSEKLELIKLITKDEDYYRSGSHDKQVTDVLCRIEEIDEIIEGIIKRILGSPLPTSDSDSVA